ncbi:preprotein translocase subunit SecE [Candidatus Peregrinibacteria bacterium]|nr:preprotein translocase subunit SecE [Candidatus Peregrinibacteria bacterium]
MLIQTVTNYFRESFQELNRVTWPTRNQAVRITAIVLIFSLVSAIFIAAIDFLFLTAFNLLLEKIS